MQFFVVFVVGAVMVGAGAMLSPAWPSSQPRIGLAASLALALVVGGAVFWAEIFGWDTLVIDYLLFALVSTVILGGTLSQAQARAEAQGYELSDEEQGWPGPEDLAFLAIIALLCAAPLAILYLPIGEQAAQTALLTFSAREGSTFSSLAPFHPEITGITPPGFHALTAYLSQQLRQPIPTIQLAVSSVVAFLCAWTAYDLGAELRDKRLGRAMTLTLIASLGIAGLYINGFFSQLMGLLFGMAFVLYTLRYYRQHLVWDMVGAGLMLGAALYVSPAVFSILLLGYSLWLVTMWLAKPSESSAATYSWLSKLGLWIGIPLVAFLGTAPWLVNNLAQWLNTSLPITETSQPALLWSMIAWHGVWIVPVALIGVYVTWHEKDPDTRQMLFWCVGWLLIVVDIVGIGILPAALPQATQWYSPLDYAWIGPIIPYTILGGIGLLWLYDHVPLMLRQKLRKGVYVWIGIAGIVVLAFSLFHTTLIEYAAKAGLSAGITAYNDDFQAMRWIAENTPEDSFILNHPRYGLWAGAVTERNVVFFSVPTYFTVTEESVDSALSEFWEDPANNESLLHDAGISHILLPHSSNDDDVTLNFDGAKNERWDLDTLNSLRLVFEQEGAGVYEVVGDGS